MNLGDATVTLSSGEQIRSSEVVSMELLSNGILKVIRSVERSLKVKVSLYSPNKWMLVEYLEMMPLPVAKNPMMTAEQLARLESKSVAPR